MTKPVILTGLRANSDLHIGNYLGALMPLIDMADKHADDYQINLFVPDLHSFTTPIDHTTLSDSIMHNLRLFVAAGLPVDNQNVHIYRQSFVPAHSELAWILQCFTGFGELSRMTEFKDKSSRLGIDHIGAGQFNYPTLMAADILLYDATYIPVGDDQRQHIEFTRNIAERLNSRFGELFIVPKTMKQQQEFFGNGQGLRIKDLQDPSKKMSKSDDSTKGVIFMTDTEDDARKKIMSATTDSVGQIKYDKDKQPGISNLIELLALLTNQSVDEIVTKYNGQTQYGPLKTDLAEVVTRFLKDFQVKLASVDSPQLHSKLLQSERIMNVQANQKLAQVQKAVGLRP